MPRLDLIILPLLAGYIFLITFNLTKFYHIRLERQRLIYNSLVFAIILSALNYLFDYFILRSNTPIDLGWYKTQPLQYYRARCSDFISSVLNYNTVPGLKHSILIFLTAWPLAKFLNLFCSREFAFDYTIERWGNHLERLIWTSLTERKDEDKLLMITTKTNKVYIGYINKLSEPLGETFITILPNFSGYRNKENLKLELTTTYTEVIKKYITEDREEEIGKKLGVVIPINEILLVSKFDNEIFGRFNPNIENKEEKNKSIIIRLLNLLKLGGR